MKNNTGVIDAQPKRGEVLPKGLMTDQDVYVKWYNSLQNRRFCPECREMVEMDKNDMGIYLTLKHDISCKFYIEPMNDYE